MSNSQQIISNLCLIATQYRAIKACQDVIDKKNLEISALNNSIQTIKAGDLSKNFEDLFAAGNPINFSKPFIFEDASPCRDTVEFRKSNQLFFDRGSVLLVYNRNGHNRYRQISELSPQKVLDLLSHILHNRIS